MSATPRIAIDQTLLADFCHRWGIERLELFGSVLRDDFTDASDVDVLVTWKPEMRYGYYEETEAQDELSGILGRRVDLVDRVDVERSANYLRRREILTSAVPLHVAS